MTGLVNEILITIKFYTYGENKRWLWKEWSFMDLILDEYNSIENSIVIVDVRFTMKEVNIACWKKRRMVKRKSNEENYALR